MPDIAIKDLRRGQMFWECSGSFGCVQGIALEDAQLVNDHWVCEVLYNDRRMELRAANHNDAYGPSLYHEPAYISAQNDTRQHELTCDTIARAGKIMLRDDIEEQIKHAQGEISSAAIQKAVDDYFAQSTEQLLEERLLDVVIEEHRLMRDLLKRIIPGSDDLDLLREQKAATLALGDSRDTVDQFWQWVKVSIIDTLLATKDR